MNPRTKFFRGLALIGALGVGLTACDEDIIIPDPLPTITITPSSTITLNPGQTAVVTASVTGLSDNTVGYTSSTPAVATVNATTGAVAAVAAGTTTITAKANAQATLQASVQVIVNPVVIPPSPVVDIEIESITQFGTLFPVDPANVFGIVDVTASVERGDATELRFYVDAIEIVGCRQTFGTTGTAADGQITAADLTLSPDQASVICSINTMAFTVANGIGIPTFANANHTFRSELRRAGAVVRSATTGAHTFNNQNFVQVTLASTANAISPTTGLRWDGGTITATAVPVVYSGSPVDSIGFFAFGPGAFRGDGTAPFVVTFATTGTDNIGGITDPTFEVEVFSTRLDGQPGPSSSSDFWLPAGVTDFRYDSEAPIPGVFTLTSQLTTGATLTLCCSNNWVGTAYNLNNGHTGFSDNFGVGITNITFHAGAPSLSTTAIAALPALPTETGADLTETALNNEIELVTRLVDFLGNASTLSMSGSGLNPLAFVGSDKTNPTAAFSPASVADMSIFNILSGLPATSFQVQFADAATGGAAPSGFGVNPVLARINRWFPGLSTTAQCVAPGVFTSSACMLRGSTGTTAVPVTQGYAQYQATAVDQGGNLSTPITTPISRITLNDQVAPASSNVAIPAVLTGGLATTFTAIATDDVNLWRGDFRFDFGAVEILPFGPRQVFNTRFVTSFAGLMPSANASTTVPFVRSLEQVTGANAPSTVLQPATAVRLFVEDAAANNFLQLNAFAPGTITAGAASFTTRGVLTFLMTTPGAAQNVWNGVAGQPLPAASNPSSTTLTAIATGASGTFANPFTVVHFYRVDPITGNELIASSSAPSVTDTGVTRTWTWAITFTPAGLAAQANAPIFAVGVHTSGDALQAADNTNVSIVPGI